MFITNKRYYQFYLSIILVMNLEDISLILLLLNEIIYYLKHAYVSNYNRWT